MAEEHDWHINLIRERNPELNLTPEQAAKIYKFEQDRDISSTKHYFSFWEECDYEASTYRQILTADQLKHYEENLAEHIKQHEQDLIESDNKGLNEMAYYNEMLAYYENVFLPEFIRDPYMSAIPGLLGNKAKIIFLRSEYKSFLNDRKKGILAEHFRHNRLFKPNELQVSLLRLKLLYLWPDYIAFKNAADEATMAVTNYLKTRLRRLPDQIEALFTRKLNELKIFSQANHKKYHGEPRGGWHVTLRPFSDEEEKEAQVMTFLLFDKEKYGYQN